MLDIEVISRAGAALKARRDLLNASPAELPNEALAEAVRLQSARQGDAAERAFVGALLANRSCGSAWFGLASLLHEHQHGGLASWESRGAALAEAADACLISARYEPQLPNPLVLLGDILNDLGDSREACRAWRAAEVRGGAHWRALTERWCGSGVSAFGPRDPLKSLLVGGRPIELSRASDTTKRFTARRLANRPAAFLLSNFSTEAERDAIIAAAIEAPMRDGGLGGGSEM